LTAELRLFIDDVIVPALIERLGSDGESPPSAIAVVEGCSSEEASGVGNASQFGNDRQAA
jgi:hypothetical protein